MLNTLELHSPADADAFVYQWPLRNGIGLELIEMVRLVCEDIPEIKLSLNNFVFTEIDTSDYVTMRNFCDSYNKAIDDIEALKEGTSLLTNCSTYPSRNMLRHIVQQVYTSVVLEPKKLNQYEPFSPEVYGETSFELVCQMMDEINITQDDVFIDLGSGVGQVILQVAASTNAKICIGIENAEVPSRYAENMHQMFMTWMKWFGKKHGVYKLLRGDFLSEEHRELIESATVVFVNNFAFGPSVDNNLKNLFTKLRDGTKIVSSKSFCRVNSKINARNCHNPEAILSVQRLTAGPTSWTSTPVQLYLHVIDRKRVDRYFQELMSIDLDVPTMENLLREDEVTDGAKMYHEILRVCRRRVYLTLIHLQKDVGVNCQKIKKKWRVNCDKCNTNCLTFKNFKRNGVARYTVIGFANHIKRCH